MIQHRFLYCIFISAFFFVQAFGQETKPHPGYVFVYAPRIAWHFGNVNDAIILDGKEIAKLGTESFFKITLDPGKYTFQVKRKNQGGVILNIKTDEKYYLKLDRDVGTVIRVKGLLLVPAENAEFDLASGLKTTDKKI